MNTNRLLEIAQDLSIESLVKEITVLQEKEQSQNVPLVLPLVGEFSAGKTTLLNSLMVSNILETGVKPTTATIYEIHFGCEQVFAEAFYPNGESKRISDIATLNNNDLEDAAVVNVFDTSRQVPSSLVIVDTPGLSSREIKHKQALVNFLPKADGLLLVVDINAQLTKSLTNFVKVAGISKRPVYLVITQCDTKSKSEIEQTKMNIAENSEVEIKGIACVSAKTGDIAELLDLFDSIKGEKAAILKNSIDSTCENIAGRMCHIIDKLLEEKLQQDNDSIIENENKLKRLRREIETIFYGITSNVDDLARANTREFEDTVFERLEAVVTARGTNYDMEARSTVASVVSLMGNKFKEDLNQIISHSVNEAIVKNGESSEMAALKCVNISDINIDTTCALELNTMGHKYDGLISSGMKIAAVAASAYFGGAAAGAAGALDAVDTATDVIYDGGSSLQTMANNISNSSKSQDLLNGVVSMVTDSTMGKPQRRRAIHNYIDGDLAPQYRTAINNEVARTKETVKSALLKDYGDSIKEMEDLVNQLKQEKEKNIENYKQRIRKLNTYKQELSNN